jgi:sulfur-carrier protein
MSVQVQLPGVLSPYANGNRAVEGVGTTLGLLFTDLDRSYPGLFRRLTSADRTLGHLLRASVNGADVSGLAVLDTEVSDGDTVVIRRALAGGAFAFAALAAIAPNPHPNHPAR